MEKQLAAKSVLAKNARNSLVETEHQLKDLGQILKYAEQYHSNHIYHVRYQKSKNPDAYLRSHETELLLHDGAENMLKRLGMNPKTIAENVDKALHAVSMEEFRYSAPNYLSGGQKQRVAIAGILAMTPKCIIFDEPI